MRRMTEEERRFIRENAGVLTVGEIATALGRNYYTVRLELSRLGNKTIHRWSERDDAILRAQYGVLPTETIAAEIGVNPRSVQNRAQKLGLLIKPGSKVRGERKKFVTKFVKSKKNPRYAGNEENQVL